MDTEHQTKPRPGFMATLYWVGIVANILTCIGYVRGTSMDDVMRYLFFSMPVLWGVVLITLVILLIWNAKVAFTSENIWATLVAIFLCTPLPSLILYYIILAYTPPPNR